MRYVSNDNMFIVDLPQSCVDQIVSLIKTSDIDETGGIVIGSYSENLQTAYLTHMSEAPSDSKSGPTWFVRGTKGLRKLLLKFKAKEKYYIGEWHYHPNGSTNPSPTDKKQMKEIAESISYKCPEPILIIIAGNHLQYQIGVFITVRINQKFIELIKEV